MRRLLPLGVLALLVACVGAAGPIDEPVPRGPLGPVIPGPAGGPPVECRGVPRDECLGFGHLPPEDAVAVARGDVARIIVTCTSACDRRRGDVRIDFLLASGELRSHGQGGYEGAP